MRISGLVWVGLAGALLLLAGCRDSSAKAPGGNVAAADAQLITLRLSDLPRGFRVGDDKGCGPFGVEGASKRLASFVIKERPHGCLAELNYAWPAKAGVPKLVQSSAVVFSSRDSAQRALALRRDLLDFNFGLGEVKDEGKAPGLGEESAAFSTENALVDGQIGQPGFGVAWRSGNLLGMVFEGGLAGDEGRGVALGLARKEQARAEQLRPISPTETDDREVSLDKPGLQLPVYWLGRHFDPPGKLPPLELESASTLAPGGGPGNQVKIDYRIPGSPVGLTLDLWTPASFRKFKRTELGRMIWSWPCTEAQELGMPEGQAVVYAGYSAPARKPCDRRRPHDRFIAHAYFDGVVVVVDMPYCYSCAGRPAGDPYNSISGMDWVVDRLRLRRPKSD